VKKRQNLSPSAAQFGDSYCRDLVSVTEWQKPSVETGEKVTAHKKTAATRFNDRPWRELPVRRSGEGDKDGNLEGVLRVPVAAAS